jgi:hypothetical protein
MPMPSLRPRTEEYRLLLSLLILPFLCSTAAAQSWILTGNMTQPRQSPLITSLQDGRVLVSGGLNGAGILTSAEAYDPATEVWTEVGPMEHGHLYGVMLRLADGKVLVSGGYDRSGITNGTEIFDPATGRWNATADTNCSRANQAAALLPNGNVIVFGGSNGVASLKSSEIYDAISGVWRPGPDMPFASALLTATVGGDLVFAAGGVDIARCPNCALKSSAVYNAILNTWTSADDLVEARAGHLGFAADSGGASLVGGFSSSLSGELSPKALSSAEGYDRAGRLLTRGTLDEPRAAAAGAKLLSGEILVAGGVDPAMPGAGVSAAERYDPSTGSSVGTTSLNLPRYFHAASVLPGGDVLMVGGVVNGRASATAERYRAPQLPVCKPPNAPAGLVGSASGSTIFMSWNAPASGCLPKSYVIEAGSGPGLANLANSDTGNALTSFTATGIPNGVYYVRVRAKNLFGASAPSNEIVITVGPVAPCAALPNPPTGLIGFTGGSKISLSWKAPLGGCPPTSYVVEAGSAPGLANLAQGDTGNAQTSYVVPGVSTGVYYVRVRAKNAGGTSFPSNEIVLTVP